MGAKTLYGEPIALGNGNIVEPYLERKINPKWVCHVYRNLNRKERYFSIKQNGLVVAHTKQLMLHDCRFKVSEAAQQRLRKLKQRNFHAFVVGYISMNGGMGTDASDAKGLSVKITYDPYKDDGFIGNIPNSPPFLIRSSSCVILNSHGVSAAYTH